ncbi:hypothetical protein GQ53DRAFT_723440 [Thozetella sp. PMI_491]|nr:hypothetical protein GQ53DRAFT_723440 [Thozetella sp. PMI_491]
MDHGRCRFGSDCKYSHDSSSQGSDTPRNVEANLARNDYHNWKRLLSYYTTDTVVDGRIWEQTVGILDGEDREIQQLVVKTLVSDDNNGLKLVRTTMDIEHDDIAAWRPTTRDFLKVITHTALLDCLSIETYVSTLYNFIAGYNGQRAIPYFSLLCRQLGDKSQRHIVAVPSNPEEILTSISKALYEIVRRERRVLFNDDLQGLFDLLDEAVEATGAPRSSANRIETMKQILKSASGLLTTTTLTLDPKAPRLAVTSNFPLEIKPPGGRHDNDHHDISQIRILPTLDEIMSDESDYLPSTNFLRPHFLTNPIQRYIDSSFRLLRHDIFGPLKDHLYSLLHNISEGTGTHAVPRGGEIRAFHYPRARIGHLAVEERRGLVAHASFAPLPQLKGKPKEEQSRWWNESPRLAEGGLACFVANENGRACALLMTVAEKNTFQKQKASSLVSDHHQPSIALKLVSGDQEDCRRLVRLYSEKTQGILVDLPSLIPATFAPILRNLQAMFQAGELPFHEWIVPSTVRRFRVAGAKTIAHIPPPEYTRQPGFLFRLDTIDLTGGRDLTLRPGATDDTDLDQLEARTGLNQSQCQALIAALKREYVLIQGPPGTGKSYLGVKLLQVLVAHTHRKTAGLGPIIVICYTNHALDQFLKHLDAVGINKIIRIGGQSRCNELEGRNLKEVSKETPRTRTEGQLLGKNYSDLEEHLKDAGYRLRPLHGAAGWPTWKLLDRYLAIREPTLHTLFSLYGHDEDGFEVVGDKDPIALAKHWMKKLCEEATDDLVELTSAAEKVQSNINDIHDEVHRRTLLSADVIGVTTTGLARNISVLKRLRSKVVVCEEAGEVLEPHIISALMPGLEHFIQIGDHRQLRPQINNHSLSLESAAGQPYQLDRSQFERRAIGEQGMRPAPVAQLNIQRRMRPEISRLIHRIYPHLQDHETVQSLPDVVGMRNNVFWLDHDYMEDNSDDKHLMKSHSNEWEACMTKALVRHIVRQGEYKSEDIAVLTPYTGQLQKLRGLLSKDYEVALSDRDKEALAADGFEGETAEGDVKESHKPLQKKKLGEFIRLATVDNFQGEEAKIVIVSLVRANKQKKVGFLRTENRINVLVSRAQHGMFLIGNAETYLNVEMWAQIHDQLADVDAVGTAFQLCCPRHRDTIISCSEPDDFLIQAPEGGCALPCERRLDACGHRCQAKCHSQGMHDTFSCPQPCQRIRSTCSHACPKLCGAACGSCMVGIKDALLPCAHAKDIKCYQLQNLKAIPCLQTVVKIVPGCGHAVEEECRVDVSADDFRCDVPCTMILPCGHACPGTCGTCSSKSDKGTMTEHKPCTRRCGRQYDACNHSCRKKCHPGEKCGSCDARCQVKCPHSACAQKCSEPCAPCIEKCAWSCKHQGSCNMPCAAPCTRLPCDERCERSLKCGHQCPSLCGEDCPQGYCQVCDADKHEARVDLLEFKIYRDIDLDETPIVVLGCGHFFTPESLDGLVGMSEVYTTDKYGNFHGLKNFSAVMSSGVPSCPDCKCPIRQFATRRYNRVINRAVMDETSKRFHLSGRAKLDALEEMAGKLEEQFANLPKRQLLKEKLRERYTAAQTLEKEARTLQQMFDKQNQPVKKLFDAVRTYGQEAVSLEERMSRLDVSIAPFEAYAPVFNEQLLLGACIIQLRIQAIVIRDKFTVLSSNTFADEEGFKMPFGAPGILAPVFMKSCYSYIEQAMAQNLPRFAIQAIICYARIANCSDSFDGTSTSSGTTRTTSYKDTARELLDQALDMCGPLQDSDNLQDLILKMKKILAGLSSEELASIKVAMVSGPDGLRTHSGHWYNCANGHPFAIGECGMPMEEALCPECGSRIGGQNHQPLAGVTRAVEMEG